MDKRELKEKLIKEYESSKNYQDAYEFALYLIDQLDEPEKLYTACFRVEGTFKKGIFLYKENGRIDSGDNLDNYDVANPESHLTEKEIKDYDERFWAFAEEVTE